MDCLLSVFTRPWNEPKKLNAWYSLDSVCVVINLSEDLFSDKERFVTVTNPLLSCDVFVLTVQCPMPGFTYRAYGPTPHRAGFSELGQPLPFWLEDPYIICMISSSFKSWKLMSCSSTGEFIFGIWDCRISGFPRELEHGDFWWLLWVESWCRMWGSLPQDDDTVWVSLYLASSSFPLYAFGILQLEGMESILSLKLSVCMSGGAWLVKAVTFQGSE